MSILNFININSTVISVLIENNEKKLTETILHKAHLLKYPMNIYLIEHSKIIYVQTVYRLNYVYRCLALSGADYRNKNIN